MRQYFAVGTHLRGDNTTTWSSGSLHIHTYMCACECFHVFVGVHACGGQVHYSGFVHLVILDRVSHWAAAHAVG